MAKSKAKISVQRGDITIMAVDAIVNAANTSLLGGGGVDGAIHYAAGPSLLEECRKLGGAKTGEAKITKGYRLPAKYVIHTPGPVYGEEDWHEAELLASCYRESLKRANEKGLKSIAFPCISTGIYGYPKKKAAKIAVNTVKKFLAEEKVSVEEVVFVVFSAKDLNIYRRLLN